MEPSNLFVCLMGMGTVFVCLTCIIFLCQLMSFVCHKLESTITPAPTVVHETVTQHNIPNRQEFIAAVSCAIAEDLGKDVPGIRIVSVKKYS